MAAMFRMYDQYSSVIKFSELQNPEESWELLELIGEGTYGEVYSARNRVTGEVAAVKILESIHEIIEEIEMEYLLLRDFNDHRNIPKFHGLYLRPGETGSDDQLWLVMEFCSRGSVTELCKYMVDKGQQLDEILIAYILKETLQVLNYLHKAHVIHRDIKGHNILITEDGSIKLIDYGVSGHLSSTFGRKKTSVGTPYWMAPEVIACERQLEYSYDIRSDIWSLGITAIELIDGEPPLADKHPMRALFRIPRNPPPQVRNPSACTAMCKDFISRCLKKDYEQRPLSWDLLEHPFIKQVPQDTTKLKERLASLAALVERVIHEPDVTTKQGRLKSRKSRTSTIATTDDLTKLEVLDEEAIVSQLFTRYSQNTIYTYIGDILLAVNPFTSLTIYNEEHSWRYMNAAKADNPPHIFAIADQAYQMMIHQKKHQCIVISGESGAGKTMSANFLVQQLTQLGKAPNRNLEERILQVNPLMEAFGNAKTMINDNSSRFGKYLEMFFTDNGMVVGAKITEYLLEKSRVTCQAQGERSFHIFYYVHDGLPSEDKTHKYHLHDNASYRYITDYTSVPIDVATLSANRVKFKAIMHCFDIIGFKPEEVSSILGVIAAILHTGNIEFKDQVSEVHAGDGAVIQNPELTVIVAKLLGLDAKDLVDVLVTTGMVARGEVIIRVNTLHEATDVRDAMAKSLYGRLFSWIVNKINILLQPDKHMYKLDSLSVIGLLDIFGFENFHTNSFEQLCINIANEQIQYYFNQHIFAWEIQEYKNEGIDASVITFVDNRPLLDMFLIKPMGLLALLDEESHFPKATDKSLVEKFHQNIKSPSYRRPKTTTSLFFSVDHYAGCVQYDAVGFLEKNRDRLPAEIVNLMRASDNSVVRSLFQTPLTKTDLTERGYGNLAGGSLKPSGTNSSLSSPSSTSTGLTFMTVQSLSTQASSMGGSRGSSSVTSMTRIQQTVATYFRFSLMDLLSKMVAGSPHFVRCIRPNEENMPDQFDIKKVTIQLTYTGVLETTRIRREGYSHRILFAEFVKRYQLLALGHIDRVTPDKKGCQILLKELGLTDWALGHTKVFLKFYHTEVLARRFEDVQRKVVRIQSVIRMHLARNAYFTLKWKLQKFALIMQKYARGWLVRRKYKKMFENRKHAAVMIQKVTRGYFTRKRYIPEIHLRRKSVVKIQSQYRGHVARIQVKKLRDEQNQKAAFIQRAFRSRQAKLLAQQKQMSEQKTTTSAAVTIQAYYRMWRCRRTYQVLQKYRDQKELQLIYFSQQVEAYSEDMILKFTKTNNTAKPVPIPDHHVSPPSPKAAPKPKAEPHPKDKRKRRAPSMPKQLAKQPNIVMDVGEERLEHMKKMSELKSLMPDLELQYYTHMNTGDEGSEADKSVEPKAGPSSGRTTSKKQLMSEEAENYYSTIVKRTSVKSETHEDDNLALGESAATIAVKHVVDWDTPILQAKEKALSPRISSNDAMDGLFAPLTSPPMQMSPFDQLSDTISNTSSSHLHVDVPAHFKSSTSSLPSSSQSTLKEFLLEQKSLNTNKAFTTLINITKQRQLGILNLHVTAPSTSESVNIGQLDLSSESSFSLAEKTSITSQDLALNMLDEAIGGELSPALLRKSPDDGQISPGFLRTLPDLDQRAQNQRTRDQLARVVAEALIANKPQSLIFPKREQAWDSPLLSACTATGINLSHGTTSLPLTSDPPTHPLTSDPPTPPHGNHIHIDDDLKTDRDEFFAETSKDDLTNTLKEEYRQSAKGKWQMLHTLISAGLFSLPNAVNAYTDHRNDHMTNATTNGRHEQNHMTSDSTNHRQRPPSPSSSKWTKIPVHYNENSSRSPDVHGNGAIVNSDIPSKPSAKVKFSAGEPTVIDVRLSKKNNIILNTNQNHVTTSSLSPTSINYRANLKRTEINPEQLLQGDAGTDKPIYDFRKMLKKTGRLDLIEQEQ